FDYGLRLNIVDKLFIAFFSLAFLYLFLPLGEASFVNKLIYLKNSMLMGMLYFFGRNTVFDEDQTVLLFKCIMGIAVAAFALNIVEKILDVHFQSFTGYADRKST